MENDDFRQDISYAEKLKKRTKDFAIRIVKLYRALPNTGEAKVIGNQFLRSGTAIAANYRAQVVGQDQTQNLSLKSELLLKKQMKRFFGSKC